MKMIASRRFFYNGRELRAGEEFNEPDKDAAADMIAIGQARAINNSKKLATQSVALYKRRDMRAEGE